MKTSVVVAGLVLCLIAIGGLPAAAGQREHAARGNLVFRNDIAVSFEAKGTPRRATGRFKFESAGTAAVGDVKCLAVKGKLAIMAGKFRGTEAVFLAVAQDNGPAQDPPTDEFFFFPVPGSRVPPCALPGDGTSLSPITSGNVRVR